MKRLLISIVLASVMFSVGAMAQSAKFAATYGNDGPYLVSMVTITDAVADTGLIFDLNDGYSFATIKVPQDKELLVGLSSEVGLTTDTSIKGRNGGAAKAIAGAGAWVVVFACPVDGGACTDFALPGPVTLSSRIQTLSAKLGGVIESCEDTTGGTDEAGLNPGDDGYVDTPDGIIDVQTECIVSDEEIGLALDTMASHHFNFVLPNMDQGEYDIVAYFLTGAMGAVDINEMSVDDGGTVSASTFAQAWIGNYMLTVQQVRATKNGIIEANIVAQ